MYYRTEGLILKKRNFGEADRILTIFTSDYGKISALVKGIRRPRSKKAGHLELGSWCKIFVARGKNLDLLTEVEVKQPFGLTDFTENRANQIYHLLELVDTLTAPGQKNLEVFRLLVHFLKQLGDGVNFKMTSCYFKVKLLTILGFFTSLHIKDSKIKKVFEIFEHEDPALTASFMGEKTYLTINKFLDTMIEDLAGTSIKTARFL